MKKKLKATIALAISVAGAAATMGVAKTGFWGGMVHNGFLAATIGGMADWFAVTALFHKPLGISYRTEIIVRNRERIMQAVVDFAGNDLLGTENVMQFVNRQDLSVLVTEFLRAHAEDKVLPAVERMAEAVAKEINPQALAEELSTVIYSGIGSELWDKLAEKLLSELQDEAVARQLIYTLTLGVREMLGNDELKKLLAKHADELIKEYAEAEGSRSLVIGLLGINGDKLMDVVWKKLDARLTTLEDYLLPPETAEEAENVPDELVSAVRFFPEDNASSETANGASADEDTIGVAAEEAAPQEQSEGEQLYLWLRDKLWQLISQQEVHAFAANSLQKLCTQERLTEFLAHAVDKWIRQGYLREHMQDFAKDHIDEFLARPDYQARVDEALKGLLSRELAEHHDVIVGMIEERLAKFSNEELVEFTEEKVADDLQMIRINGSVVGSLVGMALYVLVYAARQVIAP